MSNHEQSVSSLPDAWVRKIFAAMRATYGASFDRQWQCPAGADPVEHAAEMIGHWGRELRGYQQSPSAIAYALDHLPPNPPNLIEFKAMCRQSPSKQPQLPAPDFNSEAAIKALSGLQRPDPLSPKAWAWVLKEREQRGSKLSIAQRGMWRAALGVGVTEGGSA